MIKIITFALLCFLLLVFIYYKLAHNTKSKQLGKKKSEPFNPYRTPPGDGDEVPVSPDVPATDIPTCILRTMKRKIPAGFSEEHNPDFNEEKFFKLWSRNHWKRVLSAGMIEEIEGLRKIVSPEKKNN